MIRKAIIGGVVLLVVAVAAGAYLLVVRPTPGERVEVLVPEGATTTAIAQQLTEDDVIGSALVFRVAARVRGLDGRIAAGRYVLREGMGVLRTLDALDEGPLIETVSVTIPEGFDLEQIAQRVGDRTHVTAEAFVAAASSGEVRSRYQPEGIDLLEGLLFPETYSVAEDDTGVEVVRRMVEEFDAQVASLDWSSVEARGLSIYEGVIAASLVEREARVAEDRAKIAAVIFNRLERGMRLQIDITALYGTDHKVPTRRDLERESPYNTYLIDGLPPTPIASPGKDALAAVTEPAQIDAIYYVVVESSGKHAFTASFEEFQRLLSRRPEEVRGG